MSIWLQFAACAAVILYAGGQLSRHGDVLAKKTGLGGGWIGLVLLATVTSLPELITSVSAVTLHNLPDMAVSGLLGSCMFNMMVIAVLDLLSRPRPIAMMVHQGHMLSAGFGIVMIGLAAVDISFNKYLPVFEVLHNVDPICLFYLPVYLLAMKLIYAYEKRAVKDGMFPGAKAEDGGGKLGVTIALFVLNALLIVGAASYLPSIGEEIGRITGWGQSFIGSSFIAIATSLPEITVSVAAARMGAFDMAVANLLGSNLFNLVILALTDFCYVKAPLLRDCSPANALPALAAMISMAIVIIGLTYRSEKKILFLAGDAIGVIVVYVLANIILFMAN
jgi:cation:H+ antiporter